MSELLVRGVPDVLALERLRQHRDFISLDGDQLMFLCTLATLGMAVHMNDALMIVRTVDSINAMREMVGDRTVGSVDAVTNMANRLHSVARGQPIAST